MQKFPIIATLYCAGDSAHTYYGTDAFNFAYHIVELVAFLSRIP